MSEPKKIERIGLYFNLEIESEAKMWEYLRGKKKSYEIKKSLELAMSKDITTVIKNSAEIVINGDESKQMNNVDKDEVESEGINGF